MNTPLPWNGSTRRQRLPNNWPQLRAEVLHRDSFRCQWISPAFNSLCGDEATDVDHIIHGDNHHPSNLQALCAYHHRQKSGSEGGLASATNRAKRKLGSHYHRPTPNG